MLNIFGKFLLKIQNFKNKFRKMGGDVEGGVKLNTGKNTKLQFLQLLFSQVNRTSKDNKVECHVRNG